MCCFAGSMHCAATPTVTYPALARRIAALAPSCGPVRVVAVDGPSGAGKTLLAGRLARALGGGVPVIGSDDFPVPWDGGPLAWWDPLAEQVLGPLSAGRAGAFRPYDWRRGSYGPPAEVPVTGVLLVEGVGAAWRECPAALRIWLDAPREVRRRRVIERDGPDHLGPWAGWSAAEDAHFRADRTFERADLRLDGAATVPYDPEAEIPLLDTGRAGEAQDRVT